MTEFRAKLYKTARAAVGCTEFAVGDFVNVFYHHTDSEGVVHFQITASQHGPLPVPVVYPEHHLISFCL